MKAFLSKTSLLLAVLFLQSCQMLKQRAATEFKYDNKFILLKPPLGYCFYNPKNPSEAEVIKMIHGFDSRHIYKTEFIYQECREKDIFLSKVITQPHFRQIGAVILFEPEIMNKIKKVKLDYDRNAFINFFNHQFLLNDITKLNQMYKKDFIPKIRAKKLTKNLDESVHLNAEQKKELKFVNGEVFLGKDHEVVGYEKEVEIGVASYSFEFTKIGSYKSRCLTAATLINYIPLSFTMCDNKDSEDYSELKEQLQTYVKSLLKLNADE